MAVNTNKRVAVKWIRDGAKSAYEKKDVCHICSVRTELELHHTTSLTLLLEKWAKENGHSIDTDEDVLAIRDTFIEAHRSEIYEEVFTLCNKHHQALHRVFGKAPPLHTAPKQNRWIEKQKAKVLGIELAPEEQATTRKSGTFSAFY